MTKIIGLSLVILIALNAKVPNPQQFAKYKQIEAYEVRPGILMMPRFTSTGQVCEIGLERLRYSPDMIRLDDGLSGKEIDQILDELVPVDQRGKPTKGPADGFVSVQGHSLVISSDFENVMIETYAANRQSEKKKKVMATELVIKVRWKNRPCR